MVQGINWNNYSPNQIIELKKTGAIDVPDDVYKKAEASLSETDASEVKEESNDNKAVSYTIENTADQKNEAKELREQWEAEGADLKAIVEKFTQKSNSTTQDIGTAMKEIEGFVSYISENQALAETLGDQANDEAAVVMQVVAEAENEIEHKQDELDFLNEKIEDGSATESEQAKAEDLGKDINQTAEKTQVTINDKTSVATDLNTQMVTVNDNLKEVANKTGKALNDAKDAIEVANETKDVSQKLYDQGAKKRKQAMILGGVLGVGGGLVGAGLGLAIGSLFGKSEMKIGQAGLNTASTLNEASNNTKSVAEKIAEQNNITISEVSVSDAQVADFDAKVSEGDKSISDDAEKVKTAEAPETTEVTETLSNENNDNEETKKKPVA